MTLCRDEARFRLEIGWKTGMTFIERNKVKGKQTMLQRMAKKVRKKEKKEMAVRMLYKCSSCNRTCQTT